MIKYIVIDSDGYQTGQSHLSDIVNHATLIQVADFADAAGKMWSGTAWVADDRAPEPVPVRGITRDEFRKRFSTLTTMKLDKLEAHLEDDAVFDALCPNVTPGTREMYRDGMRTGFKNLYTDDLIHLDHPIAVTGVTLFADAGAITDAEKTAVLDTSML